MFFQATSKTSYLLPPKINQDFSTLSYMNHSMAIILTLHFSQEISLSLSVLELEHFYLKERIEVREKLTLTRLQAAAVSSLVYVITKVAGKNLTKQLNIMISKYCNVI